MKITNKVAAVIPSALRDLLFLLFLFLPLPTPAQVQTGTPPLSSLGGGPEVINLGNLNAHWAIPVLHKPGRGIPFNYDLTYDTSVWQPVNSGSATTWQPLTTWGWNHLYYVGSAYLNYSTYVEGPAPCNPPFDYSPNVVYAYANWVLTDSAGTAHPFSGAAYYDQHPGCAQPVPGPSGFTAVAQDSSGYTLSVSGSSGSVTTKDGNVLNLPENPVNGPQNSTITDRNGNQMTSSTSGVFTDTMGQTAITSNGTAPSTVTLSYTAPSGATANFIAKYTTYSIQTNFGCSGIAEYGTNGTTTASLVSEIDLPDGSKYTLGYEATPGHSGFITGRLASIALPTGGTISYRYTGSNNGIICSDGSTAGLQRTTPDTGSNYWSYSRSQVSGNHWQTTVTDPAGNQTLIDFQKDSGGTLNFYETNRQTYQGSSTLLQTMATCYNSSSSPCTGTSVTSPISQKSVVTILPGGSNLQSKIATTYNQYGLATEVDEYDFGAGAPPSTPLRKTIPTYASLGNNIVNMPSAVVIKDGSGNIRAQITYSYDQTTPSAPTGTTPMHIGVSGSRGNATTVSYLTQGSSTISKTFAYYDTGLVKTATDVNGAATTYNYPDATSTCGNAFPTSISEPLSMSSSMTWNCTGGVQLTSVDENSQTTTTTYSDAYFWRPASISFPDGGLTSWAYNSPTSVTTTTKMNSSQNIVSTTLLDGLGRTSQTQLTSDPLGTDYQDTAYDSLGRIATVSNPHRSGSSSTDGTVCAGTVSGGVCQKNGYDALGRSVSVTLQDGSVASASYSNNTVTSTDPAGKARTTTYDSLGRLTQVNEDPSGLNYVTTYGYDALSNLTSVTQNGGRSRTYVYDAMSRLTSETNPESGTVTYGYDASGYSGDLTSRVAPAPNQTGSTTVTTTYAYDLLHRLTQKSYSDGTTPSAFFSWDGTGRWGVTQTNTTGRLGEEWTGTSCCASGGAEIFSYDSMGRTVLNAQDTVPMGTKTLNYTFDLAGNMLTATNGVGVTLTQSLDAAGRPSGLTSSLVDSQHPGTLATVDPSAGYYPHGAVQKMTFGNSLTLAIEVEPRLQPCQINLNSSGSLLTGCGVTPPTGTVQDLHYTFGSWGSTNSGDVTNVVASGTQAFNRTFTYDSLNRLASLNQSSGNATGCSATFSLSWNYDAWGNRTDQSVTGGTCNSFHATVNSNNQLSGSPYQYDAAGNMTHDANHQYFYDAENRLVQVDGTFGTCSSATACYLYDALGHRTVKQTGSYYLNYLHDLSGNSVTEYCTPCSWGSGWNTGYVYFGGQLLAVYGGSTTFFAHADHLGSTRLLTGVNQSVTQNVDFLPFGEASGTTYTDHMFTGDERDSETNLDHTQFRQYSSTLGRWMHPDPAGLSAVDPSNPQSWNRYSYVLNNPLVATDPLGLVCVWDDGSYDSADDPTTGSSSGCTSQGGAWIDDTRGGTWSDQPDDYLAGIYQDVMAMADGADPTFQINVWAPMPTQSTGGGSSSSWAWTFTQTFFTGLVSADGWKAVFHSTVDEGGCNRLMFEKFAGDMSPFPLETDPGGSELIDAAPKALAAVGWARASGYSLARGLGSHAMQSSTYRALRYSTMSKAAALEEAAPYLQLGYATVHSVGTAAIEAYEGTCH